MPNFKFEHPDLCAVKAQYEEIADCIAGQKQVKSRKTRYLPQPNAADTSPENAARYTSYLARAVFYNVTRRTLNGLLGAVFETAPKATIPADLDPIVQDASGGGISLEQLAHRAVKWTLSRGRMGLFVDYPDAPPSGTSKAETGLLRPTITAYDPLDIINWRVEEIGGVDVLTLVVLRETYIESDDGFQQKKKVQYRELRLVKGAYIARLWRDRTEHPYATFNPQDTKGNPLTSIPFFFVGAENNDADVDDAPMYDLASLNIAHYRNSADYEEICFIVGQPMPVFTGLTEDWVNDVFKGRVELGSRAAIALPVGATADMLQVTESTMAFDAMEHKERQMVALGAKLVEQRETQRTATEAKMENKGETSILANVARNVSSGIEWALGACRLFISLSGDSKIEYQLNTDFGLAALSAEELTATVKAWQDGAITFEEMRARYRFAGIATVPDAEAKTTIENERAAADAREIDKADKTAAITAKHSVKPSPVGS